MWAGDGCLMSPCWRSVQLLVATVKVKCPGPGGSWALLIIACFLPTAGIGQLSIRDQHRISRSSLSLAAQYVLNISLKTTFPGSYVFSYRIRPFNISIPK